MLFILFNTVISLSCLSLLFKALQQSHCQAAEPAFAPVLVPFARRPLGEHAI